LIRMRWMHPASALVAAACTVWLIAVFRKEGKSLAALSLTTNLAAQIVIGCLDVLLLAPTTLQVVHLFSADIFWISLVALAVPMLWPQATESIA